MRSTRSAGLVLVAPFAVVCGGCGDDPTGGGTIDTSPPGIAAVTPVDRYHVQVRLNENVKETTAAKSGHYRIVEGTPEPAGPASPGDELMVISAVLDTDGRTVTLTPYQPMQNLPYDVYVSFVEDLAGNSASGEIMGSFVGSSASDVTAPTILWHTPAANVGDVPLAQSVVVQFSESMDYISVVNSFTRATEGNPVTWDVRSEDIATFAFFPLAPLERNTSYTLTVGSGAHDWTHNPVASTTWSFRTTSQIDDTPPTLVGTEPSAGRARVPVASNLTMTFSEAMQPEGGAILASPEIGEGIFEWSSDRRTFTFDPYEDLLDDTQYSVFVPPGGVRDLAGNGNAMKINIAFTTGTAIATGSMSGILSGDPYSSGPADPAGAIVVATDRATSPRVGPSFVAATVTVDEGGFRIDSLPEDTYWAIAVKDANGDGGFNPDLGDAVGIYGYDFASRTGWPDSVTIRGGSDATGVDFALFDPVALAGRLLYEGTAYTHWPYVYHVGVFDTTGFSPENPQPLYAMDAGGTRDVMGWWINQFEICSPGPTTSARTWT